MDQVTLNQLRDWPPGKVAAQPIEVLAALADSLAEMKAFVADAEARLNAGLDVRFGERARQLRAADGKDSGRVRLGDGLFVVVADVPKRVDWDQDKLAADRRPHPPVRRRSRRIRADHLRGQRTRVRRVAFGDPPAVRAGPHRPAGQAAVRDRGAPGNGGRVMAAPTPKPSAPSSSSTASAGLPPASGSSPPTSGSASAAASRRCCWGISGIGKTTLLWTLPSGETLFLDLEAGDLAVEGWPGDTIRPRTWQECRDFAVFIGGANPALRDDQPYSQAHYRRRLRALRRSSRARPLRDDLRRLDHRCRTPVLPVVQGAARGDLRENRQAGHQRHLRTARPRDDRLADPAAAHAEQERLVRRDPRREVRRLQPPLLRAADRRRQDSAASCRASSTRSSPWPRSRPTTARPTAPSSATRSTRGSYPAKDRSGRLDMIEEPHLGRLMAKIRGPVKPAHERMEFGRPASRDADTPQPSQA